MTRKAEREEDERSRDAGGLGMDAFARRYMLPLRRFFERRVRDKSEAADLVQDVLTRLVRMGDLSHVEKPENYLFRTAYSALRDRARRDAVRHREDHVAFDPRYHDRADFAPDRVLAGRQAMVAMHAALQRLPERTRDIFVLRVFEGQKTSEVARALGLATRTVEVHYAKALAAVAVAVRDHCDD